MAGENVEIAGGVGIDVEPAADNWGAKLRAATLPEAEKVGREIAERISNPIAARVAGAVVSGLRQAATSARVQAKTTGRTIGDVIGKEIRDRIVAALRNPISVKIDADTSGVDSTVAKITALDGTRVEITVKIDPKDIDDTAAKLAALAAQQIDVRIKLDAGTVAAELSAIEAQLTGLTGPGHDIRIDANVSGARADLTALAAQVAALGTGVTNVRVRVNITGAAGATALATQLAALQALATSTFVDIDVVMTGASASEVRRMASALGALRTAAAGRINIDVRAQVAGPLIELNRLAASIRIIRTTASPLVIDVQVRGTLTALHDMHTIAAFARTIGTINPTVRVTVNATLALSRLAAVLGLAAAVGSVSPTVTVNINISGLIPAQAGIAAVQSQASGATLSMGLLTASFVILATVAIPAVAGLAVALFAVAAAAVAALGAFAVVGLAAIGIAKAIQAVTAAQDQSGQSAGQAAAKQAAMASALDGVRNAERGLTSAKRDAATAERELTEAREDARRSVEDLALAIRGNDLQIERANDDLAAAEAAYRAVKTERAPGEPEPDAERQARLAFEEAKLRVDELVTRQKRLAAEQEKVRREGIEGSDQVTAARERLRAANERVIVATEQLAAAHRQMGQAAVQSAGAGNAAAKKAADALAALSPAGREFVRFLLSLKDELKVLQRTAEAAFLPGLQRGIQAMLPILPFIVLLLQRFGTALGGLAEEAGKALAAPFWIEFFDWLGTQGLTIFLDFARAIGYVVKGFASLLMAFGPSSQEFSAGLLDMAKAFADWAASVGDSQGFKDFINYAREQGPKVVQVLGDLTLVLVKLAIALVPLATLTLDLLVKSLNWLLEQDPGIILTIAAAIAVLVAVIAAGPITIGVAIAAIVGLLVYCYARFEWFRNVVDAVWAAWLQYMKIMWQQVWIPLVTAIVVAIRDYIAPAFVWLWQKVIVPAWNAISTAVSWYWQNVLSPTLSAIWWYISHVLGPVFFWLYENVVKPVWSVIQVAISVAWVSIQVIFGLIVAYVKVLGAIFSWLYDNAIGPAWRKISETVSSVWEQKVKPVLSAAGSFITDHVAPAFRRGVDLLGFWWNALVDLMKTPVRIVVKTVIDDGLLGAYRWIAEKFNLPNKDIHVPLPKGFAAGGFVSGPGGPTSDSIMARLSAGEYVIPARVVAALGLDFFDWLIGRRQSKGSARPGDGSEGLAFAGGGQVPGFAEGGLVGWLRGAWNTLTDPVGELKKRVAGLLDGLDGGTMGKDVIGGVAHKAIDGVIAWVTNAITNIVSADGAYTGPISADVASVQQWIRAQNGKPYIWASAGPRGYDCSGAVSAVWNLLHGRNPYSHTFSTMNQAPYFPKRNMVGVLTAGWANSGERGGGSVGHTAANLAGQPFESTGSRGFHINAVTPYSSFAHWGSFDVGGWLQPGLTLAYNGTGSPERVLTSGQWSEVNSHVSGARNATYNTNIYPQRADLSIDDLEHLDARRYARARLGRPS